ncbi:hypothetical protein Hdeb2414_s0005g00166001 [Helianthus debilis subsp. tardiflorus]
MEIEDWAGGSSDSEASSPESDNKDHCYAYGDLPKLQFRPVRGLFVDCSQPVRSRYAGLFAAGTQACPQPVLVVKHAMFIHGHGARDNNKGFKVDKRAATLLPTPTVSTEARDNNKGVKPTMV